MNAGGFGQFGGDREPKTLTSSYSAWFIYWRYRKTKETRWAAHTFKTLNSRSNRAFFSAVMSSSRSLVLKRFRSNALAELSARKMSILYFSSLFCTVDSTERFRFGILEIF